MSECPYCHAVDEQCAHLMLVVDTTFRTIEGGHLYDLADERYRQMSSHEDSEEEAEILNDFLDEMLCLSTAVEDYEFDVGPARCSGYVNYYCEDAKALADSYQKLLATVERFRQ